MFLFIPALPPSPWSVWTPRDSRKSVCNVFAYFIPSPSIPFRVEVKKIGCEWVRGVFPILPNGINHLLRLSRSLGPSGHVHHHHKEGITCRQVYTHKDTKTQKHKDAKTQRNIKTKTQGHTHIALARLAMSITSTSIGGRTEEIYAHKSKETHTNKETQHKETHKQQGKQTHTLKIE